MKTVSLKLKLPVHLAKFVKSSYEIDGVSFYQNLEEYSLKIMNILKSKEDILLFNKEIEFKETAFVEILVRKELYISYNEITFDERITIAKILPYLFKTMFARALEQWYIAIKCMYPKTKESTIVRAFLKKHDIENYQYDFKNALMILTRYKKTMI